MPAAAPKAVVRAVEIGEAVGDEGSRRIRAPALLQVRLIHLRSSLVFVLRVPQVPWSWDRTMLRAPPVRLLSVARVGQHSREPAGIAASVTQLYLLARIVGNCAIQIDSRRLL